MTEFSQKCRFYLQESGSNVYQIARTANLDRTTVQRMLTGKRLPSQEFVTTFCNHLRINSIERHDLIESYKMEKIGKSTYMNRKYIQNLIEHIVETQSKPDYFLTLSTSLLPTDSTVKKVLTKEFERDDKGKIFTNIPPSHNYIYRILTELHLQYKKSVPVQHMFSMYPNPLSIPNSSVNLEKLYYIVPFLFSDYSNYQPCYFYSRNLKSDYSTQLFPYYLITSSEVTIFSSDLKHCIIHSDEKTKALYNETFLHMREQAHPLMVKHSDPLQALSFYLKSLNTTRFPTHSIESQPCVFAFLPIPEKIARLCPDSVGQKADLLAMIEGSYQSFDDHIGSIKNICTTDGFRSFYKDGILHGAFTIFSEPFSEKERKEMIHHFRTLYMEHDSFYFLNDSFKIPNDLQIELYDKNQVNIVSTQNNNFNFLGFTESSICDAFYDFAESLCESEMLCPVPRVLETLDELLKV
ncbi:MAG: hypothetical protein PHN80_10685 [Hespellia sp.]|nr:hypothetical protein [Hespellia sp.]